MAADRKTDKRDSRGCKMAWPLSDPGFWVAIFLLAGLFAVGVFDVWVSVAGAGSNTVSTYIHLWSKQFPIVPFAAGILAGHLFAG